MCLVLAHDEIVTIQVGERCFTTNKSTLTEESSYFASLLSGRWDYQKSENGNPFIDADPMLFDHILRYLRRGVFPLFYNRANGFDEGLYTLLMHEADFFGIDKLTKWIAYKRYEEVVTVHHTADVVQGRYGESRMIDYDHKSHPGIEKLYFPCIKGIHVYRCPRNIRSHIGDEFLCGKGCANARVEGFSDYEEVQVLHTLIITKSTVFNRRIMM